MTNFTRTLAEFVVGARASSIPDAVFARATAALVDTVGCALAGHDDDTTRIAIAHAGALAASPRATVWGAGFATAPGEAAFVNGIAAHVLDFDDSLPGLRGHPSAPILAALLAAAEQEGASGRDVLAAFAVSLEVIGVIGKVLGHGHYFQGWHTTGTVGIFGATAAVARILGADAGQLCAAWGIAASEMAGLRRNFGTMAKSFHVGHAARSAYDAAWLARRGFTANPAIFDGAGGVFAVYGGDDGIAPEAALATLGNPWRFLDPGVSVKRWPCCFGAHRPLGGLFRLIEQHEIKAAEVERVVVGFLPHSDRALAHTDPATGLEGKFSMEYCAAAALLDGDLTLGSFTDEKVRRPDIRRLMAKVERRHIPGEGSFNAHYGYSDIDITTRAATHHIRVDQTPGSKAWPLSDAELKAKFIGCVRTLKDGAYADALFAALHGIAACPDVGALLRARLA